MGDQGPEVHGGGGGGWAASSTGLPSRGHPRPPDDFANVKNIPHVSNPCPQRPPSAPGNAAESAQASPLHGPAQEDLALGLKARTQPRAGRLKGWGGVPQGSFRWWGWRGGGSFLWTLDSTPRMPSASATGFYSRRQEGATLDTGTGAEAHSLLPTLVRTPVALQGSFYLLPRAGLPGICTLSQRTL